MRTRLNLQSRQRAIHGGTWKALVDSHRPELLSTIESLISCDCSESLLQEAERKLTIVDIPEPFKLTFALRTVVKFAIARVQQCDQTPAGLPLHGSDRPDCPLIRSLPPDERFVYFLTEQLNYPRRDVSLLVGISDSQAEHLLSQARRHLHADM